MSENTPTLRTVVIITVLAVIPPLPAADGDRAVNGSIAGRIQNDVTSRYLENARLTIRGTDVRVLSEADGRYRITNVPSGAVTLDVFYTGLEPKHVTVTVMAGQTVTQDVQLAPLGGAALKMDPFQVESAKMTDQASIAINEQRFAPNIKTVVANADISEQPDGNIGELLKFLPGVSPSGGGSVSGNVMIRGFPPNTAQITVDGGSMASTTFGSPDRTVQVSNETPGTGISRMEVTKVPTPATGADTMAGSVNMVTRTAFEASRPQLTYLLNVAGVLQEIGLKRNTGWEERQFAVKPGFSLRYTNPLTKNFGFAVSASTSIRQRPQEGITPTYNYNSPTFGSSPSKPLLQTLAYASGSAIFDLANFQLRADWRVTPQSVLSGSIETYHWRGLSENFTFTRSAGNVATPTTATGSAGTFGENFTRGATGRGTVGISASGGSQHNKGGIRGNLRYGFNNGDWKIDLQTGLSKSRFWRNEGLPGAEYGAFTSLTTANATGSYRVDFLDVDPTDLAKTIKVYDAANQEVNVLDPNFFSRYNVTTAFRNNRWSADLVQEYKADVKRTLRFLPFSAAVQVGGAWRARDLDYKETNETFTYRGPGGNQEATPFMTLRTWKVGEPKGQVVPLASHVLAYRAWQSNPDLFFQTPAQIAETERISRLASERIKETVEAVYFQAEGRFFNNRLNILTGVRYEKTTAEGLGSVNAPDAVWQRNADGSYVLAANGARVRKPEAGAAGSLEEIRLTWQRRAARSERSYDGFYPSIHFNYNVTENFLARAAYAQTYGRPNFSFIVPRTVVTEFTDSDGDVTGGRLNLRNTALLPWTANNYDLSFEYYSSQGGVFGLGLFRKEVDNFFGSHIRPATELDLREAGVDVNNVDVGSWQVNTTYNAASAKVHGFEVSMNHSLRPLDRWAGAWIRNFSLFANATKLKISGTGANDLTGFLPFGYNAGLRFNRKPFMISVNSNYRGKEITGTLAGVGPNGRNYRPARTHIDAALSITLRRNIDFFFNVRNLFNDPGVTFKESDELPTYVRRNGSTEFGAVFNAGFKGSF